VAGAVPVLVALHHNTAASVEEVFPFPVKIGPFHILRPSDHDLVGTVLPTTTEVPRKEQVIPIPFFMDPWSFGEVRGNSNDIPAIKSCEGTMGGPFHENIRPWNWSIVRSMGDCSETVLVSCS